MNDDTNEYNPWVAYEFGDGLCWQRRCTAPGCEHGLLLCPARFCGMCGGSGYEVTHTRPDEVERVAWVAS